MGLHKNLLVAIALRLLSLLAASILVVYSMPVQTLRSTPVYAASAPTSPEPSASLSLKALESAADVRRGGGSITIKLAPGAEWSDALGKDDASTRDLFMLMRGELRGPGSWNAAVAPALANAGVARVSSTTARITLPPVPGFDPMTRERVVVVLHPALFKTPPTVLTVLGFTIKPDTLATVQGSLAAPWPDAVRGAAQPPEPREEPATTSGRILDGGVVPNTINGVGTRFETEQASPPPVVDPGGLSSLAPSVGTREAGNFAIVSQAPDADAEKIARGLQGLLAKEAVLLNEQFGTGAASRALPVLRTGAGTPIAQAIEPLEGIARLGGSSLDSRASLFAALEQIAGPGNVSMDADGNFRLTVKKTVVAQVPMAIHNIPGEQMALSSRDPLTLTVALEMSIRFGITADGDFFVDNATDRFTLDLAVDQAIDVYGRLGFVDIVAPGSRAVFNGRFSLDLAEDLDGRTLFWQIQEFKATTLATAGLAGTARIDLPSISLAGGFLPGVTAHSSVSWPDITKLSGFAVDASDLEAKGFRRFRNVDAAAIIQAINSVAGTLHDGQRDGVLSTTLPLTKQSMANIVDAGAELQEELARVVAELKKTDAAGAPLHPNPSASDIATLLRDLGLARDGAGLEITTETVLYRLQFTKPVFTGDQKQPQLALDLKFGDNDPLGLTLDRRVLLTLSGATAAFDLAVGMKIKDEADLARELGIDLRDSDHDGKGLVDPCGFDSKPCSAGDAVDPDADGDGQPDPTEDQDDDGDMVAETFTKRADQTCKILAFASGQTCAEFLALNNLPDEAAYNALPAGTVLRLDPVFNPSSPLTMQHRVFLLPGEKLVTLSAGISGTIDAGRDPIVVDLGFLDLVLNGAYSISPVFDLGLADTDAVAADGKVDLKEVSLARKAGTPAGVLHVTPRGRVDSHFTLANPLLDGASPGGGLRRLEVVGNLSALDNAAGAGQPVFRLGAPGADPGQADVVSLGQDLNELLGFRDITAADMLRLLDRIVAWLDATENDPVLDYPLPFIDKPVSKIVSMHREFAALTKMVRDNQPKDLTTYDRYLRSALAKTGVAGLATLQITQDDIRITMPFGVTRNGEFPLTLLVPHDGETSLIRSIDPKNKVKATAILSMPLTMGLRFGTASQPFDQRGFVTESSAPSVSVSLEQWLDGTKVSFRHVTASVSGSARVPSGAFSVTLRDPNRDGYVTIAELLASGGAVSTSAEGTVTADMTVSITGKDPFPVVVRGNLRALENARGGREVYNRTITDPAVVSRIDPATADQIYVDPAVDLQGLLVDMETMVSGFRDYAQLFVDTTDLLNVDLPMIGDAIGQANTAGQDMVAAADYLDQLLTEVQDDDQAFLSSIEVKLQEFLNPGWTEAKGENDPSLKINVTVTGSIEDQEVVVEFNLTRELTLAIPLSAGLDLDPVFNLDFATTLNLTIGFEARIGIGVSADDGFFVEGGRILGLYARAAADGINVNSELLGFLNMQIRNGSLGVGGPFKPVGHTGEDDPGYAFLGVVLGDVTDEESKPRVSLFDLLGTESPDKEDVQRDASCGSTGGQAQGCDQGGDTGGQGGEDGGTPFKVGFELELFANLPIYSQIAFDAFGTTVNFPTIRNTLDFKWAFDKFTGGAEPVEGEQGGGEGGAPEGLELSLKDIGIDLAGFRDLLLPPLEVFDIVNPMSIDEIRYLVTTPVPILEVSLLDLARSLAPLAPSPYKEIAEAAVLAVDMLIEIADFTEQLRTASNGEPVYFTLGTVDILPDFLFHKGPVFSPEELMQKSPVIQAALGSTLDQMHGTKPFNPIKFPFLEDPIQLANLLSGKGPATFFELDMGGFPSKDPRDGSDTVGIFFGPNIDFHYKLFDLDVVIASGSFEAGLRGCLCLILRPGIGFDSRGLEPGHSIMDGLYIKDYWGTDAQGHPVDLKEIEAVATVQAFVAGSFNFLGVVDITASGGGGITLEAGIDINDESKYQDDADRGDGKLHLDEITAILVGRGPSNAPVPASKSDTTTDNTIRQVPDSLKNLTAAQVLNLYRGNSETGIPDFDKLTTALKGLPQDLLSQVGKAGLEKLGQLLQPARLSGAVTAVATSLTVTDGSRFQSGDTIEIDAEKLSVTGVSGNSLTVTRAAAGSTAAAHASGASIVQALLQPVRVGEAFTASDTTLTVADGSKFKAGDIIEIGSEKLAVTAVSGNDLTVTRGVGGTPAAAHANGTAITPRPKAFEILTTLVHLPKDTLDGSDISATTRTNIVTELNILQAASPSTLNPLLPHLKKNVQPSSMFNDLSQALKDRVDAASLPEESSSGEWTPPEVGTSGGTLGDINFANILCLFNFETRFYGNLYANITAVIDLWLFSVDFDFHWSTDFTIFEFRLSCNDTAQVARVSRGGVLKPLVGPEAGKRGGTDGVDNVDGDEEVVIHSDDASPSTVTITVNGSAPETFTGVTRIEIDGGNGRDRIVHGSHIGVPVILNGGDGDDTLQGGTQNDEIRGGPGNDTIEGFEGNDLLVGEGGTDTISGGDGNDVIYGDNDNGTGSGVDILSGGSGNDEIHGGASGDSINGDDGNDSIFGDDGNDTINGNAGADTIHGNDGNDGIHGNAGNDTVYGDDGDDTIDGDEDVDTLYGGMGIDTIHGNDGNDVIDGGHDADTLYGDDGDDTVYGGSGIDQLFGGMGNDTMDGGSEGDAIEGQDGDDTLAGGLGMDTIHGNDGIDTISGGPDADEVYGDAGDDFLYGGSGDDEVFGGTGNDYLEGNEGRDTLKGEAGDDDLIGGTSFQAISDAGDILEGGIGHDVIAGDNATITRPGGTNAFDGSLIRVVTLLDINSTDIGYYGNDQVTGGDGNDIIYGGGADDTIHGDGGDDIIQGNSGVDTMWGDSGDDDIAGGTGRTTSNVAGTAIDGRFDGVDTIYGGDGYDVIAGDNADIVRTPTWALNTFNAGKSRVVTLLDVAIVGLDAGANTSGNDVINGEANDDVLYGGGGTDIIHGNDGDDLIQGNDGADTIYGDAGQDDILGGTGRKVSDQAGTAVDGGLDRGIDTIHGGNGSGGVTSNDFDVIAGDNADIVRTLTGGLWTTNTFNAALGRVVRILDVGLAGSPAGTDTSGNDVINGEANDDEIYGGAGNDLIHGNQGEDFIFGNAGSDTIYGDEDRDDIVGGTGRTTSNDLGTAVDGRLDGNDRIFGGTAGGDENTPQTLWVNGDADTDYDTIAGDNAVIDRALRPDGTWALVDYGKWNLTPPSFLGTIQHIVRLLDVGTITHPAAVGTNGDDTIFGEGNDDELYGQDGNDKVFGNDGDDVIYGALGDDDLIGGRGNDTIYGQSGIDIIQGGGGKDATKGGEGQTNGTCTTIVGEPVETGDYQANNARDPSATKGRDEGSKGNPPKRRNPECLQPVSISVTPATASVANGGSVQLTAIATYSDGSTRDVTNEVVWVSSNESIARVVGGRVEGVAAGIARITAVEPTARLSDSAFQVTSNSVRITVS